VVDSKVMTVYIMHICLVNLDFDPRYNSDSYIFSSDNRFIPLQIHCTSGWRAFLLFEVVLILPCDNRICYCVISRYMLVSYSVVLCSVWLDLGKIVLSVSTAVLQSSY